jgi:hypothetical protein
LVKPQEIHTVSIFKLNTWLVPRVSNSLLKSDEVSLLSDEESPNQGIETKHNSEKGSLTLKKKFILIKVSVNNITKIVRKFKSLLKFMAPLGIIYIGQYLNNQGLVNYLQGTPPKMAIL